MEEVEYMIKASCGCLYRYHWTSAGTHKLWFGAHIDPRLLTRQKEEVLVFRGNGQEEALSEIEVLFAVNHHISIRQIMGVESTVILGRPEKFTDYSPTV